MAKEATCMLLTKKEVWPGRARDHYVSVISNQKWPPKKRHTSKYSFLTINCWHLKANYA